MTLNDQVLFIGQTELATLQAEVEHLRLLNAEERKTIDELASLLLRAADVLEGISEIGDWNDAAIIRLVNQLREVAK